MTTIDAPARESLGLYGLEYQNKQVVQFRNRRTNHWRHRIELARKLVQEYSLPRLEPSSPSNITIVDVGCANGTFAIEFAHDGFQTIGVDFDPAAIDIARALAAEEGVNATFAVGDVCEWESIDFSHQFGHDRPSTFDIAICFDIFEHLHDDELGVLLHGIRKRLSPDGTLVFHTFPNEFDHIFWHDNRDRLLRPFAGLSARRFYRLARAYACLLDASYLLRYGRSRTEAITDSPHCNPLTRNRLRGILQRAGFDVLSIETATLYFADTPKHAKYAKHDITHRNIFGVAAPR